MKLLEGLKKKWEVRQKDNHVPPKKEPEDELLPRQPIKGASVASDDQRLACLVLLTPREYEIYQLLIEGYTLKESAERLNIKYSTANTYMTGVYKKLHVNSRAMLIIRYRDVGTKPG